MRIVHVNKWDIQGGAAIAAYRLHKGLLELGQQSKMLVQCKDSQDPNVHSISISDHQITDVFCLETIQHHYIGCNRTDISNTPFNLPYPGIDLTQLPEITHTDVVNLHWVAGKFQSPITLHKLFKLNKPIVWTLHDMWAFTGGCHYAANCKSFEETCERCPQLADDPYGLPNAILKDKLDLFDCDNLTIVTPSRWLADCAVKSRLFKQHRIEVIPNSVETDIFYPLPKQAAKQKLGLSPKTYTILFGAQDVNEKRKGFPELLQAIRHCLNDQRFKTHIQKGFIKFLCFGRFNPELAKLEINPTFLGYIDSYLKLSEIYAASDVFILPSLEDNLPNVMLEAMSCGTPVIGFDIGGIPDLVQDKITGRLISAGNTQNMAQAILDFIFNSEQYQILGKNCRNLIERSYSLPVQAQHYLELYQDLLKNENKVRNRGTESSRSSIPSSSRNSPTLEEDLNPMTHIDTAIGENFNLVFDKIIAKSLLAEVTELKDKIRLMEKDWFWFYKRVWRRLKSIILRNLLTKH